MSRADGTTPWLAAYAAGAAEALSAALGLLDTDDVTVRPSDAARPAFVLEVDADPPRAVRALSWSDTRGWAWSADPGWRRGPRWFPLPVPRDVDALTLAETVGALERSALAAPGRPPDGSRRCGPPVRTGSPVCANVPGGSPGR